MSGKFRFLKSAVGLGDCPQDEIPEVAVLGRSNSGKSSLINAWVGSRIAKVSQVPGKTRLINFFSGPKYRLVDLPGYGYSARSGDEQAEWSTMIEPLLSARANVKSGLILVDSRRALSGLKQNKELVSTDEKLLFKFLHMAHRPFDVVFTKADKLGQSDTVALKRAMADFAEQGVSSFLISSQTGKGVVELEEAIFSTRIKPTMIFSAEDQE